MIAGVLGVIGAAAGGALYYLYPVQVSMFAGLTRNYLLSSTPPGTTTTESNAAYKAAEAAAASPVADAPSAVPPPQTGRATTKRSLPSVTPQLSQINTKNVGKLKVLCTYDVGRFTRLRVRPDHGGERADRHDRIRYFLAQPGDLRRELAHARGLSAQPSAGQPRRRLPRRHAVSRHPGRAGAGL